MTTRARDASFFAKRAMTAATPWLRARAGVAASGPASLLGGVPVPIFAPPHLRAWTRFAHAAPYGSAPRVVPSIRSDDDRVDESRGARAERLRRARMQHEVRLFKEKAREELSREHWVKQKLKEGSFDGNGVNGVSGGGGASRDATKLSAADTALNSFEQNPEKQKYGSHRLPDRLSKRAVALSPDVVLVGNQRCIRVGVVGVPNAGKSQLVNSLVGGHVSAVSPKTNTTRGETIACVTKGDTQVLFIDLPGVVGPEHYRNPKHAAKVSSAWAAAASCDSLLFIVDAHRQATRPDPRVTGLLSSAKDNLELLRYTKQSGLQIPNSVLALNKVDLFTADTRGAVKSVARQLSQLHPFTSLFPISAKRGAGVANVLGHFVNEAPLRRWELDPSQSTDKSNIDRAVEVVRECVYQRLHKELPYNVVPLHDTWENFRNGAYKIEQTLVVDSVNVKQIVVGRRGSAIGQIGIRARTILEEIFERKVHLVLHVKVRKKNKSGGGRRATSGDGDRY